MEGPLSMASRSRLRKRFARACARSAMEGVRPMETGKPVALSLYAHPFSSYSMKALIALYENDIPFTYRSPGGARGECRSWRPSGR